jgi:hypothetical protein
VAGLKNFRQAGGGSERKKKNTQQGEGIKKNFT